MSEKLKPCPFCGGQAEIKINMNDIRGIAYCTKCNVVMNNSYKNDNKIQNILEELICSDWNRRIYEEESVSDIVPKKSRNVCSKNILDKLLLEFSISDYLLDSIKEWIEYKKERNFNYKERGMKSLLKTTSEMSRQYGDEAVATAIRESISSGYQGIVWDKVSRNSQKQLDSNAYWNGI